MKRMKKSFKKLYIFELLILLLLIINSFMSNILGSYKMIGILLILIIIFEIVFGFEKDRHRHLKIIILNMFIYLLFFFIVYYLFGLVIGFYKTSNYYTLYGFKTFIAPLIILTILKEFLRYGILCKTDGNKKLIVLCCIIFIIMDIYDSVIISSSDYKSIFLLISLTVLPAISNNILCTYLSLKVGYKPNIIYLLIIKLYVYLLPIVPNPTEYIKSLIDFLLPIVILLKFYKFFKLESDEEIDRYYKRLNIPSLLVPLLITIVLVYFVSGYFKYYAIAVASGSMSPNIDKGDVVVVKQKEYNYEDIEIGDVIAYKYKKVIVIHRVIKKIKSNDEYYFYTKGDANKEQDNFEIKKEDIVGVVKFKIKKIGLPTVWLKEAIQ